jgi:hypothetical protein
MKHGLSSRAGGAATVGARRLRDVPHEILRMSFDPAFLKAGGSSC